MLRYQNPGATHGRFNIICVVRSRSVLCFSSEMVESNMALLLPLSRSGDSLCYFGSSCQISGSGSSCSFKWWWCGNAKEIQCQVTRGFHKHFPLSLRAAPHAEFSMAWDHTTIKTSLLLITLSTQTILCVRWFGIRNSSAGGGRS